MKLEYEQPFAEIINFRAMEQLATAQSEKEARDGGNVGNPNLSEGVGDWP